MRAIPSSSVPFPGSRYVALGPLGSGGMGTVLYGQLTAPGGFSRPVAIKRMHPHLAEDPQFVSLFMDEARLAARIAHSNVVSTLDVLELEGSLSVVMEYVHGESLATLWELSRAREEKLPQRIAISLMVGVLHGLHAAHETRDEAGRFLGLVHRDVSHDNILVGEDGVARLLDFGIAKAAGRARSTPAGELKGKLAYMAPEQYSGAPVDRRVDVYGASVVLWELLVGRALFTGESQAELVRAAIHGEVSAPQVLAPEVPSALGALVMRGLSRDPALRFETARAMALALEQGAQTATQSEVCAWLDVVAGERLAQRAAQLARLGRQHPQSVPTKPASKPVLQPPHTTGDEDVGAALIGPPHANRAAASGSASTEQGVSLRRSRRAAAALVVLLLVCAAGLRWWRLQTNAPLDAQDVATHREGAVAPRLGAPKEPASAFQAKDPAQQANEREQDRTTRRSSESSQSRSTAVRRKDARPARGSGIERSPPAAATVPADSRDCAPPYTVDERGIRRFKPECL